MRKMDAYFVTYGEYDAEVTGWYVFPSEIYDLFQWSKHRRNSINYMKFWDSSPFTCIWIIYTDGVHVFIWEFQCVRPTEWLRDTKIRSPLRFLTIPDETLVPNVQIMSRSQYARYQDRFWEKISDFLRKQIEKANCIADCENALSPSHFPPSSSSSSSQSFITHCKSDVPFSALLWVLIMWRNLNITQYNCSGFTAGQWG